MRRRLLPLLLLGLAGGTFAPPTPAAAVSDAEARATVAEIVSVAGPRTPESMRELCERHDCTGMSRSIPFEPAKAPGPGQPPRELCTVALPPLPMQQGARPVVLESERGDGRRYLTHVLVERDGDRLQVPEPGLLDRHPLQRAAEGSRLER